MKRPTAIQGVRRIGRDLDETIKQFQKKMYSNNGVRLSYAQASNALAHRIRKLDEAARQKNDKKKKEEMFDIRL